MTINGPRLPNRPDWMSIHEASFLMGVSPATLRRWSDAGRIQTFTTPGGHRRFSRSAVARLLPAETERPSGTGRHELSLVVHQIPWFAELDPAAQRALRRHARRIATSLVASREAVTLDERASRLAEAESSAAACGIIAAGSGVGLRQTVEALLAFRGWYLRAFIEASHGRGGATRASAANVGSVTDTFDRLVCRAMRAHEAVSGRP